MTSGFYVEAMDILNICDRSSEWSQRVDVLNPPSEQITPFCPSALARNGWTTLSALPIYIHEKV